MDPVGVALERCPFLRRVSAEQGESFARRFVANPRLPAAAGVPAHSDATRRPIFEEAGAGLESLVRAFHGPGGVVPLARYSNPQSPERPEKDYAVKRSPVHSAAQSLGLVKSGVETDASSRPTAAARIAASTASIGLSAGFPKGPRGGSFGRGPGKGSPKHNSNPNKNPSKGASASATPGGAPSAPSGGKCPLRGLLGPLGGLLALPAKMGKMKCPAPICAVRGAIAKTKAVRHLRPHGLPVKFLAVSAFTAAVNVPCGAWRETFEKFSPGWFVAVHLTIPVVGMLRKALLMPPYAIVMTIAAAIAGQQIGAKVERMRRARHVAFTSYSPELAASYGCCPVLPPLHETPKNSAFALEVGTNGSGWDMAKWTAAPATRLVNTTMSAVSAQQRLSPLLLSVPAY